MANQNLIDSKIIGTNCSKDEHLIAIDSATISSHIHPSNYAGSPGPAEECSYTKGNCFDLNFGLSRS